MLITVIAPEFVMGMACAELYLAMVYHPKLREFALADQVPWTWTHTYYANMGGFVIQSGVGNDPVTMPYVPTEKGNAKNVPEELPTDLTATEEPRLNVTPDGDGRGRPTPEDDESHRCHNPFHLTASEIWELRNKKLLSKLPYINKDEIDDRSTSGPLLKAIAVGQIIWSTTQIIARGARGIAISQLEIAVIAFAACAIVIYAMYWSKPKEISTVTTILRYQDRIPNETLQNIDKQTYKLAVGLLASRMTTERRHGSRIENDMMEHANTTVLRMAPYAMIFGATIFGGIHIGAWNFEFPSRIDLILWRSASLYSAAFGGFFYLISVLDIIVSSRVLIFVPVIAVLYVIARLILLVEIFRTLCFLPPGAFIGTWASSIPHVG